ncbi:amino acid adenylation domain-containing protein [Nonomuraea sp. NN258]|uniref:non-ribosomal peptide synthetase n=1 Tax=Nonomuraea antri TaxID=2730852 RepID=UPI001569FC81|nr:non-ribosomal peptide synthetase [Nonomuraea antri]NRQ38564.1 amino acid adenylation domain-containing protein [Nonomuraea antri]
MRSDLVVPLAPAQRRLWALAELRPDDPFYSIPFAIDLDGPLDVPALRRCLDEIVRRHAPLRAGVRQVDGDPVLAFGPAEPVDLPTTDLSGLSEDERALQADELTEELVQQPFELTGDRLWRAHLLRLAEHRHRLLVSVHHIVFDGPSIGILLDELTRLYAVAARGLPPALPELPMDYAEHLLRRRRESGGAQAARVLRYWTDRLTGAPEAMELPLDGPRPAWSDHRCARVSVPIPAETLAPLRDLAAASQVTMFMLLKAAWDVVLRQHGVTDVLMGVPLAGRDSVQAGRLIGCFTQPVVLRTELAGDPSFTELLAEVRRDVLNAHEHGEVPFEEVLRALQVTYDPSYYPFYQVTFSHQAEEPEREAAGVAFAVRHLRLETTPAELEITLADAGQGLLAHLDYRLDLFEESIAERMPARFATVLERIARDGEARVSELTRPDAAETRLVVEEWNDSAVTYPADRCVHHLVEAQAERTPDAVAARHGARRWTYRELDEAANRVGHHLRMLGVAPETAVGVCLPRSLELLAVILGVFKAGGVYVPLDPELPGRRLRTLIDDARPAMILAGPDQRPLLTGMGTNLVTVDTADRWAMGARPAHRVESSVVAANAAYILFTSGSTGGPKGVVLEHRNLTNLLTWAHRELGAETFASVPLIGSMAFDVSMFEIFAPLTCGGTVVVAEDALSLARTPGAETLSLVVAVPSILAALLESGGVPASAPTVISTGEVLPPSVLADLYALETVETVHNMYAPTETTTFSLSNVVYPGEPIPIGRPVDNTVAYVLDARLRPVAPGVVGQLHLGGAGISRGYLNKPGLTAERFVPDPFSAAPGRRLYATGDMVRHRPDGRLQFVGRVDHQVKLRGCRIELGEVEAAMLDHPGVAEACAMVARGEDGSGGKGDALVAAVVPRAGETLVPDELRAHLQRRLPGYMVPARVSISPGLPLLSSGKLDRQRILRDLAAAPAARHDEQDTGVAEKTVAAAWAEVLGHAVEVNQNFFDAGGNSLLLVLLRERLRQAFDTELHVTDLFRYPTVRTMAAFLSGDRGEPGVAGDGRGAARRDARQARARRRDRHPG